VSKRSTDIYFGDLVARGIVDPSRRTSSTRAHGDACDIVIPAYNALDALDHCLTSVRAHTSPPFRVIVVDDASDEQVACYLRAVAAADERVEVLRNERNLGFVRTANRGLSATTAPFACLLNSDTIVTPGWLDALIRCARSDSRIGVVNPTSNAAVNLTVQMAPGLNVFTMAEVVAARSRRDYPDVVTAVGFCLLVTRAALERFGTFDEIYGDGYCEESDYCMRITGEGLRTVVADDAFVYHRGGASFGRSRARYLRNRRLFDERWGARYPVEYAAFLQRNPLQYLRDALEAGLDSEAATDLKVPRRLEPGPTDGWRKLWAMTRDAWSIGGAGEVVRKLGVAPAHLRTAVQQMLPGGDSDEAAEQPAGFVDPEQKRRQYVTPAYAKTLPQKHGLRIAVLVWRFDVCGGVLTIVDIVNRLVLEGHSVVLATVGDIADEGAFTLYTRPLVYRTIDALVDGFPDVDVVVTTFWPTATEWLPAIRRRQPSLRAMYFIQDYEAWFVPEEDHDGRKRIVDSYGLVDGRIVTSHWLARKLSTDHGYQSTVVPIGIDLRVFYPRGPQTPRPRRRILVQARPETPWRGWAEAVTTLNSLWQRRDDFEAVLFGCDDEALRQSGQRLNCPHHNAGLITSRSAMAALYSSCDLLFDPSYYQAFGLPGLEAMACGIPTVLPARGGLTEYAAHEQNTLLAAETGERVKAIERVLDDDWLRARLVEAGLATASRFSAVDMARGHLEALVPLTSVT
jgi:GT2 family glycosyltransferase/glycosyltransferase involved in cell wall biosynthesis